MLLARKKKEKADPSKRERAGESGSDKISKKPKIDNRTSLHRSQEDHHHWERRRQGFHRGPVYRPFEAEVRGALRLNFNYWMQSQKPVLVKVNNSALHTIHNYFVY